MSTYEEEIFNYLTKKENFISAHEIYQKFPDVKEQLIKEFWSEVQSILKEMAKGTDWKVSDVVFDKKYHILELYCAESESICVAFDEIDKTPCYCLYINYEENKKLDRVKIDKYASNIDAIHEKDWEKCVEDGSYLKYLEDDFTNIDTLKRILPENRDDFVNELAKLLFDFAEELKGDILKMCKMTKK